MKKIFAVAAVSFLLGSVVIPAIPAYAEVYKYVDKNGILCFSDNLQSVPEEYRTEAVLVDGKMEAEEETILKNSDSISIEQQPEMEPVPELQKKRPRPFTLRLLISAAVGLCSVLLLVFISKEPRLKENKKVVSGIRTALIAVLSIYLVTAHARDVMTLFGLAGKAVDDIQQQSAEKGKKAAQAMKQLDSLFEDAQKAEEEWKAAAQD